MHLCIKFIVMHEVPCCFQYSLTLNLNSSSRIPCKPLPHPIRGARMGWSDPHERVPSRFVWKDLPQTLYHRYRIRIILVLLWAPKDYAEGDSCFVGVPACGDPGAVVSGLRLGYMLSAHSRVPYDLFFSRGFEIRAARSGPTNRLPVPR